MRLLASMLLDVGGQIDLSRFSEDMLLWIRLV